MKWFVYVLSSTLRVRTYVGISTDVDRRVLEHNGERPGGARSTRAGRPWVVAKIYGPFEDRAAAQRAEHAVKTRRGADRASWTTEELSRALEED